MLVALLKDWIGKDIGLLGCHRIIFFFSEKLSWSSTQSTIIRKIQVNDLYNPVKQTTPTSAPNIGCLTHNKLHIRLVTLGPMTEQQYTQDSNKFNVRQVNLLKITELSHYTHMCMHSKLLKVYVFITRGSNYLQGFNKSLSRNLLDTSSSFQRLF